MVTMFNKNMQWGWITSSGEHRGIKKGIFTDEGVRRLAEVTSLIERLKTDRTGYVRFYRGRETCTIRPGTLELDSHGLPYRQWMTLDKVVAILTPSGSIELHNKYTGKLYCTMTADPRAEWVDCRR